MSILDFFKKNTEKADPEALREELKEAYGIEFSQLTEDPEDLLKEGYRKASPMEFARLSELFRFVPQIVAGNVSNRMTKKAFADATKGTYRVLLGEGWHLGNSRTLPGAKVGMAFDASNKLKSKAELIPNDAVLNISSAPKVALGVFNAASFVTGQYFLSEINGKLSALQTGMDRIEHMLDDEIQASLENAFDVIEEVARHTEFINSTERRNQSVIRLQEIASEAGKIMKRCHTAIMRERDAGSSKDNEKAIKERAEAISRHLYRYFCAVKLYCLAKLNEITLNGITDIPEIELFKTEFFEKIEAYKSEYAESEKWFLQYLKKNHALNNLNVLEWVGTIGFGFAGLLTSGVIRGTKQAVDFYELFSNSHKKKLENNVSRMNSLFGKSNDMAILESCYQSIEEYIQALQSRMDIVQVNDEFFIKSSPTPMRSET